MASSWEQFTPLRKKQKRASTGIEDNFVTPYVLQNHVEALPQDIFEKVACDVIAPPPVAVSIQNGM